MPEKSLLKTDYCQNCLLPEDTLFEAVGLWMCVKCLAITMTKLEQGKEELNRMLEESWKIIKEKDEIIEKYMEEIERYNKKVIEKGGE